MVTVAEPFEVQCDPSDCSGRTSFSVGTVGDTGTADGLTFSFAPSAFAVEEIDGDCDPDDPIAAGDTRTFDIRFFDDEDQPPPGATLTVSSPGATSGSDAFGVTITD